MKRKRQNKACQIIQIDQYREGPEQRQQKEMRKALAGLTVEIYQLLKTQIHYSNVALVVGIMLEKAEDVAELYNKPGRATEKMNTDPKLYAERLNRAKEIMEWAAAEETEKPLQCANTARASR